MAAVRRGASTPGFGPIAAAACVVLLALMASAPVFAQGASESIERFSLDSVIGVDSFGGQNVSSQPQIVIDVSAAVRIGDNWQLYVRPWFRLPRPSSTSATTPPWDTEIYQAGIRYERPGPIAVRVDAGYILSPIGLGLLDSRQNLNPNILPHLTYVVPMPTFAVGAPRVLPVSNAYPLGAQLTVSTTHWDARAAVVNSAPTRPYILGGATNPRQTPVFVAGGGVTPITGLRLGASFAHGDYATADEITLPNAQGRAVTMFGGEGEWAFRYTKIRGEILRSAFEVPGETAVAREWFVQGVQTLAPRWFVAARGEGASAPPLFNGITVGTGTNFAVFEATVGFRVTPDITLRGAYDQRKSYGATSWDNQAGVSIVWTRRWW